MIYMTHDENYQYFFYNGTPYRTGTMVKFKDDFTAHYTFEGEHIWKYARFCMRMLKNGRSEYLFLPHRNPENKYSSMFRIPEDKLEYAIEEIIKPIPIELVPKTKKKDTESAEVMIGWLIYPVVLFFSLIFKEWYVAWFWATLLFFIWRNKKLWE